MAKIPCNFRLSAESVKIIKDEARAEGFRKARSQAQVIEDWAKEKTFQAKLDACQTLKEAREMGNGVVPPVILKLDSREIEKAGRMPMVSPLTDRSNAKPLTVARQLHQAKD